MSEEKKENQKNELTDAQAEQVSGGIEAPKPDDLFPIPTSGSVDYFEKIAK